MTLEDLSFQGAPMYPAIHQHRSLSYILNEVVTWVLAPLGLQNWVQHRGPQPTIRELNWNRHLLVPYLLLAPDGWLPHVYMPLAHYGKLTELGAFSHHQR